MSDKLEHIVENEILSWLNFQKMSMAIKYDLNTSFNEQTGYRNNLSKFRLRGFADIIVYYKDEELGLSFTFLIEVKTKKGVQSVYQKAVEKKMKALGISYYLCRSLEEAKDAYYEEIIRNRERVQNSKAR
jgi:hypothetical protein